MTEILNLASWVSLSLGGIFCLIGGLGLLRMPDFFTRLHAASVIETLGAGLLILGMLFQSGLSLTSVKLIFILLLIFFASPTATHALARAAKVRGIKYFHKEGEND